MKNNAKIKAILFDLDGTLLPMDQDIFIKAYFGCLAAALAPRGYKSEELIGAIWSGTKAMIRNDGQKTNEERFWDEFAKIHGEKARADERILAEFYERDFDTVSASCGFSELSRKIIDLVKGKGYRAVLATNPIFPEIATRKRARWAGLEFDDFELVTHYSNSRYCKPSIEYYKEILKALSLEGEECVMIGNDVCEDMIARELGMRVFLLTDNLINKDGEDISAYEHGGASELMDFLRNL